MDIRINTYIGPDTEGRGMVKLYINGTLASQRLVKLPLDFDLDKQAKFVEKVSDDPTYDLYEQIREGILNCLDSIESNVAEEVQKEVRNG
jgi:hypothetical protein